MEDNITETIVRRGLPKGLQFVGLTRYQEFTASTLSANRPANMSLFVFRAKNIAEVMDDAEAVKDRLQASYNTLDNKRESVAEVTKHGTELVAHFKLLNSQAFELGALSKEAFAMLDVVADDVIVRIGEFMSYSLDSTRDIFVDTLAIAMANGAGVSQLKQLCFEMDSLTDFWRKKVVNNVSATLESIHQHNLGIHLRERPAQA